MNYLEGVSGIKDKYNSDKDKNNILIITGGHIDEEFLREKATARNYNIIIVADRGLIAADNLNLNVDFIVGDFDSVDRGVLNKHKETSTPIKLFPKEKDKTDTHIAIDFALTHNPLCIDIIGATGNRLDHVLANINMLLILLEKNVQANILDKNNKIYLMNKSFILDKHSQYGEFISLIPFNGSVHNLTLNGFKYPLNNVKLKAGTSLGISNEIIKDEAYVKFAKGLLLVIESKD